MPNLDPTPPLPVSKSTSDTLAASEFNQVNTALANLAAAVGAIDDGAIQTVAGRLGGLPPAANTYYVFEYTTVGATRPTHTGPVVWVDVNSVGDPTNISATDLLVRPSSATRFDKKVRTAGDVTSAGSTYTIIPGTRLTVSCAVGDVVMLGANGKWLSGETAGGRATMFSLNSGLSVAGSANSSGVTSWGGLPSTDTGIGSPFPYTITAGDIVGGTASFDFYIKGNGGNRSMKADTNSSFVVWAMVV